MALGGVILGAILALGAYCALLGAFTRFSGLVLFILAATGLSHMHTQPVAGTMPAGGGGIIGQQVANPLLSLTGALGTTLFLLALVLVGITLFTGLSWFSVMDAIGNGLGYSVILIITAVIRELFGTGRLFGYVILPVVSEGGWYVPNGLMGFSPAAFFNPLPAPSMPRMKIPRPPSRPNRRKKIQLGRLAATRMRSGSTVNVPS